VLALQLGNFGYDHDDRRGYDALVEAGASEEKARAAAEAVTGFENRFARIETDLTVLK
jgi:hypothetical protein